MVLPVPNVLVSITASKLTSGLATAPGTCQLGPVPLSFDKVPAAGICIDMCLHAYL